MHYRSPESKNPKNKNPLLDGLIPLLRSISRHARNAPTLFLLLILALPVAPCLAQQLESKPNFKESTSEQEKITKPSKSTWIKKLEHSKVLKANSEETSIENGQPVTVGGYEVFRVRVKLGPYTPKSRVQAIENRIKNLDKLPKFDVSTIRVEESAHSSNIAAGKMTIFTVTDLDAQAAGEKSRQELANQYAVQLRLAIEKKLDDQSFPRLLWRIGLSVGLTVSFVVVFVAVNWGFPRLYKLLASLRGKYFRSLKFQKAVLLSEDTVISVCVGFFRLVRLLAVILIFVVYSTLLLGLFPQSRGLADSVVNLIMYPLAKIVWPSIYTYLPNLVFIAIILVCSFYVISFTRFVFDEIGRETISFSDFEPDWAEPTYKIVRFLLVAFTAVLIFPYLPGSGSPAFQQISLFLGILVSLGSSGSIAHLIAGIFLTYTGAFKVGDRVKIDNTTGDIVEKTLLATKIRTIKHEIITIPNGLVLGSHIINYSSSAASKPLVLHTTITIGYDAPWKQVHQLLIDAALTTENVLAEPAPFVFQTSLDDYYVSYQINAYINQPLIMASIYSSLHQNIQDGFNQAGVEIMSPHYSTLRDGNQTTIPGNYLDQNYETPSFLVASKQTKTTNNKNYKK